MYCDEYHKFSFIVVVLAIIPNSNNNNVVAKLVAEIWEHGDKSERAKTHQPCLIEPPGSILYHICPRMQFSSVMTNYYQHF